jgi:hypothetical protein
MKKIIFSMSVLAGAFALSSCSKSEEIQEPQIVQSCVGTVCSLAVVDDTLNRYTNLLGKSIDRVVKRTQLKGDQDQVTWIIINGKLATNNQLLQRNLMSCIDSGCSLNSNPTGLVFNSTDNQTVSVSGTIVNADGTTREISIVDEPVNLEMGKPIVSFDRDNTDELTYKFTADSSYTGIPDDATYTWYVDDVEIASGEDQKTATDTFTSAGSTHKIKLVVSADSMESTTVETTIVTGAIKADIVLGTVNGRSVSVSVDNTTSGLPAGTAYTWSVDSTSVTGSGKSTTLELPEYDAEYTINLTATMPTGTTFTDSKMVTTGFGNIAITKDSIGDTGTDYTLTAVTTDTGIPDDATFEWIIDSTTLTDITAVIKHDFVSLGNHTISVQAKVSGEPIGQPASGSINITQAGDPKLSTTAGINPLEKIFTAGLANTGIDNTWTKSWTVNGATVPGETGDALTQQFDDPDTTYTVEFIAAKDGQTKPVSTTFTTPTITLDTSNFEIGSVSSNKTLTVGLKPNTGITDDWTIAWSSSSDTDATFSPNDALSTTATFVASGTETITFKATSPNEKVVSWTLTGIYVNPLAEGDLVLTGIPSSAVPDSAYGVVITTGANNSVGITCPTGMTLAPTAGFSKEWLVPGSGAIKYNDAIIPSGTTNLGVYIWIDIANLKEIYSTKLYILFSIL